MPETPEDKARKTIDDLLTNAGWFIQDRDAVNLSANRGVAIREFPLKTGYGFADYLLYVDGAPAGVIEAKKEGETLTGYEIQTEKYSVGLPDVLKPYRKPLPFCYQSTGIETRFTNLLEPDARSRPVFAFHRPETLADWLMDESKKPGSTLRARLRHMPPLGSTATLGCELTGRSACATPTLGCELTGRSACATEGQVQGARRSGHDRSSACCEWLAACEHRPTHGPHNEWVQRLVPILQQGERRFPYGAERATGQAGSKFPANC